MERSLRILDSARAVVNEQGAASVRRPRRSGLVLMEDASRAASTAASSSRRPCCSRWRRWRPRGRPTSRRAGTASRRRRRARRSPLASSRRARRTSRTARRRSTSRCSRSGWTPTRATRPSSPHFYRKRFRPEFRPAFEAWVATRPRTNRDAPLSPFAMPQYKLAATAKADRLEAQAAAFSAARGALHPAGRQLLAGRRAVRRVAVLRGHQHPAALAARRGWSCSGSATCCSSAP